MAVQSSTRKWVFIGGGVIAAAALVVMFQNYPPQPKDAAGTIGAAQRYHEPQITGADVNVSQDALTTWIQSDTFDRIVKDPQARKLFTDAAVSAMISDAALKLKLQEAPDQAAKISDKDAVKLGRFIAIEDASRVEVNLSADAVRKLSEVVDASTARTLMEAMAGDKMRTLHLLVAPDLALKLKLLEANGGDAAKLQLVEAKSADAALKLQLAEAKSADAALKLQLAEAKSADAAKLQLVDAKTADSARRLSFTADEARRVAVGAQDYSRRLSLSDPNNDAMRYVKMSLPEDASRRLTFVGADAALKLKLIEAAGSTDASSRVELKLDADTARRLEAALGAGDNARLQVALGPDGVRMVASAIDAQFARVQAFNASGDAARLMNVAFSNANISAALNNADFVRAYSSNSVLAEGLVAKVRSEYIDQN
jgi:hypothetical protein